MSVRIVGWTISRDTLAETECRGSTEMERYVGGPCPYTDDGIMTDMMMMIPILNQITINENCSVLVALT